MKKQKQDVLIIKTGYSEILDFQDSNKSSLGDVLRTTSLLHLFKNDNVTWLTDKDALPLLEGNPYINKLLQLDLITIMHLLENEYDTLINLEKNLNVCKLSNIITAWRKYGFRYDKKTNDTEAYDRAFEILNIGSNIEIKRENNKTFQQLLFEMVGATWKGEEYVLGYKSQTAEKYDIGLNTTVGSKWPTKCWPIEQGETLERMLIKDGLTVSRQDKQGEKVLSSIQGYIDWINSCKMIVGSDSLGLHLGLALKKKVLGIFGPTSSSEIEFYGRGEGISPKETPLCAPCFKPKCDQQYKLSCIELISAKEVYDKVKKIFNS